VRAAFAWLQADRRRWLLPGGVAFVLLGSVAWFSFHGSSQPRAGVSPDVTRFGVTLPAKTTQGETEPAATSAASAPRGTDPPAAQVDGDRRFAIRKSESRPSCGDVLGRPFAAEAEGNRAKAGQMWTRSRKSLMLGNEERAVKEMCLSASWDINGRGTYGLSEYYFRESDFAQALTWAERVPETSRRYVDARAMIGDVHNQQGDLDAALDAYMTGWNMSADDENGRREVAGGFAQAADSALRKKDWWTAERFYRRALTLDGERAEAASGLASVLLHFEYPAAAVLWAERALELEPKSSVALLTLCEAHIEQRDAAGARAALKRLRAMAPDDTKVGQLAQRVEAM
jgi:hypothetical protein